MTEVSILGASRGHANLAGSSSRLEEHLLRVLQRALPAMQAYSSNCVLTSEIGIFKCSLANLFL